MVIRNVSAPNPGPRRPGWCSALAAAAALACVHGAASAAAFTGMGSRPFGDFTAANVSDTGVVYGLALAYDFQFTSFFEPPKSYRYGLQWNGPSQGYVTVIDTFERSYFGGIAAMSANGMAAGFSRQRSGADQAAVWSSAGPVLVGPSSSFSFATAVSADGRRAAGIDYLGGSTFITPNGLSPGYSTLPKAAGGFPPIPMPGASFTPSRLSADGLAVVGSATAAFGPAQLGAYVFSDGTANSTWQPLQVFAGPDTAAVAVSNVTRNAAGSDFGVTVAGNATLQGLSQAFIYQKGIGDTGAATFLGVLDPVYNAGVLQPYDTSRATAMSADGSLVLGTSSGPSGQTTPFIWTSGGGMKDLGTVLFNSGANLAGWQLQSVTAVSQNGQYIAGLGLHNGQAETWVANLLGPRLLYSDSQASTLSFSSGDSWRDRVGGTVAAPPGAQDDLVLQAAVPYQRVSLDLSSKPVVQSIELVKGSYSIFGLSGHALTVSDTLKVNGVLLQINGFASVTAKKLIVGSQVNGGVLEIGQNDRDYGTRVTLQSAEIAAGSRIRQEANTTLTIAGTLTVGGEYRGINKSVVLGTPAILAADHIEVLGATCDRNFVCTAPANFVAGGALQARSIRNAGNFLWQGDSLVVGSGTPAHDASDAFWNEGMLTVRPQGEFQYVPKFLWVGNLTNDHGGTVKTYGMANATNPTVIDWGTGTFTNKGSYISDPAVNIFGTLVVAGDGTLAGGAGDAFQVRGDFINTSNSSKWDVGQSTLSFLGTGAHTYSSTGSTAWGALQLDLGVKLALKATGSGPVSFSFAALSGLSSLADLQDRFSADSGITIQVASIAGGWAQAGTITLPGGGTLIAAVPEPGTAALWLAGLLAVSALVRRRGRT